MIAGSTEYENIIELMSIARGINERDAIPTMYCSLVETRLYFFDSKYVLIFPAPIPNNIRYGYKGCKMNIIAKGVAQQSPFTILAVRGHDVLFFNRFLNGRRESAKQSISIAVVIANVPIHITPKT
jgi:hypothetical protein